MIRRSLLFILLTALLVAGCVWLADRPGEVTIHWQGWRLDTTVPALLLTWIAALVLVLFAQHLLRWLIQIPSQWLAHRRARRKLRGYQALTDGMAALAAGDAPRAKKLAASAQALLNDHRLTGLLVAQATGLAGDDAAAQRQYQSLLDRPETVLAGCQGMLTLAQKRGDQSASLDWAQRAWSTGSASPHIAQTLFDLQANAAQWAQAEITLTEAERRKAMTRSQTAPLRAKALLERAASSQSLDLAQQSLKFAPQWVPAIVLNARLLTAAGKAKQAARLLHESWSKSPHPDLSQALAQLVCDQPPLDRVSRLQDGLKPHHDHPDALLILARTEVDAQLWGPARAHLEQLAQHHPSAAAYLLLAQIERLDRKDDSAAARWTELAALHQTQP